MIKDQITVIEEMIQSEATSQYPDLLPIFVGTVYDITNTVFVPGITSYVLATSYPFEGGTIDTEETYFATDTLWDATESFIVAHPEGAVAVTINGEYTPTTVPTANAKIYADNLRTLQLLRPNVSTRFTLSGYHLHDEFTDFYEDGDIQKGDIVSLPSGRMFKISGIARHDLYFDSDTYSDDNIDVVNNQYSIYRYFSNVDVGFVNNDGTLYFSTAIPIESLPEATFRFFDKEVLDVPLAITKHVPGELSETLYNPVSFACSLSGADTCYYVPLPDESLESYAAASELIHDSNLVYCIVPLTDDHEKLSLFSPTFDEINLQELKIVLATTPLVSHIDVTDGSGSIGE